MKRLLMSSLGLLALCGCSTPQDVSTASQKQEHTQVSSVQMVNWNNVELPANFSFHFTPESQLLENSQIQSPVGGFSFHNLGNPVKLEVAGIVKDLSVFAPNVAVYDQNFQLIKTYKSTSFDYDRDDFVVGEALHGEVLLTLPIDVTKVYVLVYTTQSDLELTTTLIHPAKAFAIAKRVDPPKISDPVASHSTYGEVEISISEVGINQVAQQKALPAISNVPLQKEPATPPSAVLPDTQKYYHDAIKQAVAENNIPKALSLLEEAKALNVAGAQQVFVSAVNQLTGE